MKRVSIALVFAALLSGCGSAWDHPGVAQSVKNDEWNRCKYEAEIATANTEVGFQKARNMDRMHTMCIQGKGWVQVR